MPPTVFAVPINAFSPKCNVVNVMMSNKMLPAKLSRFVVIVDLRSLDNPLKNDLCHCIKKGH